MIFFFFCNRFRLHNVIPNVIICCYSWIFIAQHCFWSKYQLNKTFEASIYAWWITLNEYDCPLMKITYILHWSSVTILPAKMHQRIFRLINVNQTLPFVRMNHFTFHSHLTSLKFNEILATTTWCTASEKSRTSWHFLIFFFKKTKKIKRSNTKPIPQLQSSLKEHLIQFVRATPPVYSKHSLYNHLCLKTLPSMEWWCTI